MIINNNNNNNNNNYYYYYSTINIINTINIIIIIVVIERGAVVLSMVSALAIISEGSRFDLRRERWSFLATEKTVSVTGHDVGMF